MSRNKDGAAGFTLIELLVAVTLIAILVVALNQGFRIGTRAADLVDRGNDRTEQIALAYDFLQKELSASVPLPAGGEGATRGIDFTGEPYSLSIVTVPPAYLALGGFHLLHLGLEPTGKGSRQLVVSWAIIPRGPAVTEAHMLQPSILMNGVREATFGYFGPSGDSPAAWHENWQGRNSLPWLIRLRILLDDGIGVPELIVQPRLGNPARP